MPLELSKHQGPLNSRDADLEDVLHDLQGNILNGHGRDRAIHMFLRFNPDRIADARRAVASLAQGFVTSAKAQMEASARYSRTGEDAGLFAHLGLSAEGYRVLGVPEGRIPRGANLRRRTVEEGYRNVFVGGLRDRTSELQDPAEGSWDLGFREPIHAVIIGAADSNDDLGRAEAQLRQLFECASETPIAMVAAIERGAVLRRHFTDHVGRSVDGDSVEHFGYVDGRSQPVLLDTQLAVEGHTRWDPVAPPSLVLVADPNGEGPSTSFGSFMAFRKLEQDVRGFARATRSLAAELGCAPALVGAMAVGRFEAGTPIVLQGTESGTTPAANDFDYGGDPEGQKCPFHAHIRKTNPRSGRSVTVGDPPGNDDEERGHRLVRRGIPYGAARTNFDAPPEELPDRDVGLLFICYQSDLWEQFEFQQRAWSNNARFPHPGPPGAVSHAPGYALGTGIDALVGQQLPANVDPVAGAAVPRNWPAAWNQRPTRTVRSVAQFVTMKGGEYFFSPSLSGIRKLEGDRPSGERT